MKTNILKLISVWAVAAICFAACSEKNEPEIPKTPPVVNPLPDDDKNEDVNDEPVVEEIKAYTDGNAYANFFAYNVMGDAYLWKDEVASGLNSWGNLLENAINEGATFPDAIVQVEKVRYKNENREDIDKWSQLTDDYESFIGSVDGAVTTTYGCSYNLFLRSANSNLVVAFVLYVYPDSPAEEAGLKRGDMILTIDGKDLTTANYMALYNSSSIVLGLGVIEGNQFVATGDELAMTATHMYENPVFMTKVFDCGGKKVGYLVYHSFTLDSCPDLIEACKYFKSEGVTELVIDLRYNGGGYVITENLLASMLAPEANVKAGDIYQTEIWNSEYMDYYNRNGVDLNTYFKTEYKFKDHNGKEHTYSTADANIGLNKIYALVASGSASASESLLVGLLPYMDIEIIGEQTHGKYTTGSILSSDDWFADIVDTYDKLSKENPVKYGTFSEEFPWFSDWKRYGANWGMYVMINRYADKDGNTPCMPDGFVPDVEADDKYNEPYNLGDDRENLLRIALEKAGKTDLTPLARSQMVALPSSMPTKRIVTSPLEGKRIKMDAIRRDCPLKRVE